jgi:hypothetical protein
MSLSAQDHQWQGQAVQGNRCERGGDIAITANRVLQNVFTAKERPAEHKASFPA